jgi:hypothetical protein
MVAHGFFGMNGVPITSAFLVTRQITLHVQVGDYFLYTPKTKFGFLGNLLCRAIGMFRDIYEHPPVVVVNQRNGTLYKPKTLA